MARHSPPQRQYRGRAADRPRRHRRDQGRGLRRDRQQPPRRRGAGPADGRRDPRRGGGGGPGLYRDPGDACRVLRTRSSTRWRRRSVAAEGPVLAYCRSGTRSCNLWALAAAKAGRDPELLVAQAEAAGYDLGAHPPDAGRAGARHDAGRCSARALAAILVARGGAGLVAAASHHPGSRGRRRPPMPRIGRWRGSRRWTRWSGRTARARWR